LVERHPYKVDVIGSSPVFPTKFSSGGKIVLKTILFFALIGSSVFAEAVQLEFKDPKIGSSFYLKITAVAISDKGIEFGTQYEKTVCIVNETILEKANISGLELIEKIQSGAWEKVTILCQKKEDQWVVTRITSSADF
jgi:hypothetical protein